MLLADLAGRMDAISNRNLLSESILIASSRLAFRSSRASSLLCLSRAFSSSLRAFSSSFLAISWAFCSSRRSRSRALSSSFCIFNNKTAIKSLSSFAGSRIFLTSPGGALITAAAAVFLASDDALDRSDISLPLLMGRGTSFPSTRSNPFIFLRLDNDADDDEDDDDDLALDGGLGLIDCTRVKSIIASG